MLLLGGCFRVENTLTIDDDGSGTVEIIVGIDPEVAYEELTGEQVLFGIGFDDDEVCDSVFQGMEGDAATPDQGNIEPWRGDGLCGMKQTWDLAPSLDHSEEVSEAFGEASILKKDGDIWVFDITIEDNQVDEFESDDPSFDRLIQEAEYIINVNLPGTAIDGENNATKVSGARFTWDLDPADATGRFYAQAGPNPPFAFTAPLVIAIAAAALGLLALVWFFVGSGKSKEEKKSEKQAGPVEPPEPYFDEANGIWVLDDPERGRLWHDKRNNRWLPV